MEVFRQKVTASAGLLDPNAPAVDGTVLLALHSKAAAAAASALPAAILAAAAAAASPMWPSDKDTETLAMRAGELGAVERMVSAYLVDPVAPMHFPKNIQDDLLPKFMELGGNDEAFQEFLAAPVEEVKPIAILLRAELKKQVLGAMSKYLLDNPTSEAVGISAEQEARILRTFNAVGVDEEGFQKFVEECAGEFKAMSAEEKAALENQSPP